MLTLLRWTGILVSALAAFALTALAVVYFSPGIQKSIALKLLNEQPGIQSQIGHLHIRWSGLDAEQVFILQGRNGISVDSVRVRWQPVRSVLERRGILSLVAVDNLFIDASHWVRHPVQIDPDRGLFTGALADDDDEPVQVTRRPIAGPALPQDALAPLPEDSFIFLYQFLFEDGLLPQLRALDIPVSIERLNVTLSLLLPDRQSARGKVELTGFAPGQQSITSLDLQFHDPLMQFGWQHYAMSGKVTAPINRAHQVEEIAVQLTTILNYRPGLQRSTLTADLSGRLRPNSNGEVLEMQIVLDQALAPVLTNRMVYNRTSKQWTVQAVIAGTPPSAEVTTAQPIHFNGTLSRTPTHELGIRGELTGEQLKADAWLEFIQGLVPFPSQAAPSSTPTTTVATRSGGTQPTGAPSVASSPSSGPPTPRVNTPGIPVTMTHAALPPSAPFWQGLIADLEVFLREIHWQQWIAQDVRSAVTLRPSQLAKTGDFKLMDASLNWAGTLGFQTGTNTPYRLDATFTGRDLDGGALLAPKAGQAAKLWEGRFKLDSSFHAEAADVHLLAPVLQGRMTLTSTAGTLRLMGSETGRTDNVQQLLGGMGALLGGGAANLAGAGEELMRQLREIVYHHMSLEVSRGPDLHFVLDQLDVRSRDLRVTGSGTLFFDPTVEFMNNKLDLGLRLSTRGNLHDRLGALRLSGGMPDDFGYFSGPRFVIGGSLAQPTNNLQEIFTQALRNALVPARGNP